MDNKPQMAQKYDKKYQGKKKKTKKYSRMEPGKETK